MAKSLCAWKYSLQEFPLPPTFYFKEIDEVKRLWTETERQIWELEMLFTLGNIPCPLWTTLVLSVNVKDSANTLETTSILGNLLVIYENLHEDIVRGK